MNELISIETKIYEIRGQSVMLDSDIAELYQVETSYLNRQVKRHSLRFEDDDFMFQLNHDEFENLKCQIGTSSWGGKRKQPNVFTEQGVYMLATVINSKVAIDVTKAIMRAFTKMREFTLGYKDIVIELQSIRKELKETKGLTDKNSEHIKTAFVLTALRNFA
jgi:phage regulator Rha-like protein